MKALKKWDQVKVHLPQTNKRGPSQFHKRKGAVAYRTQNNSSRYFIHLDGDPVGVDTEFLRSELLFLVADLKRKCLVK